MLGDDLGWNIDNGYIDLRFSSQLATDGTPCLVIDYGYGPRYDLEHYLSQVLLHLTIFSRREM